MEKRPIPAEAAKSFFAKLAAGQPAQAYAESAFGFQAQQTEKAFVQTVKEMNLNQLDALDWESVETER